MLLLTTILAGCSGPDVSPSVDKGAPAPAPSPAPPPTSPPDAALFEHISQLDPGEWNFEVLNRTTGQKGKVTVHAFCTSAHLTAEVACVEGVLCPKGDTCEWKDAGGTPNAMQPAVDCQTNNPCGARACVPFGGGKSCQ